jgi:hypothetical protein
VSTDDSRDSRDSSRGFHQLNIGHLVMGIALLGIVGVWALAESDTVKGDDVHWLMPIPWVVAGVVGLVATAITGTRRHAVRQTGWVGPGVEPGSGRGWVGEQPVGTGPAEDPADDPAGSTAEALAEQEPREPTAVEETAPITAARADDPTSRTEDDDRQDQNDQDDQETS